MAKKKKQLPFHSCTIKKLPERELVAAAKFACSVNPANAVKLEGTADEPLTPKRIAVLTGKFWGAAGKHFTVGFMSQAGAALQEKIVAAFNQWNKWCNVSATITSGAVRNADIRISLGQGGYWSYLGTDMAQIPSNQNNMNLQGFSLSTPESEYNRVPPHEFAHAFGCPHEHSRQEIIDLLDRANTIRVYKRDQHWSEAEIVQQIFTSLSAFSIRGTPQAKQNSIQCYWFSGECTKNGQPIIGGSKITEEDGTFMGTVYPLAVTPPPPPPTGETITFDVSKAGYKPVTVTLQKA